MLVGTGVQNLRAYEKAGLVAPDRTVGGNRLDSQDDLEVIQRVLQLLDEGLNLIGVARVLELEEENSSLRRQLADAQTEPPVG